MINRPLLLLDVDGVLALSSGEYLDHPHEYESFNVFGDFRLHKRKDVNDTLEVLKPWYEFVWATMWHGDANTWISPAVGLPSNLPFIHFPTDPKLPHILSYVNDRPFAWVDDNIYSWDHSEAREAEATCLLLRTNTQWGLLSSHVDQLISFAKENV